jgi:hypothetical protein
MKSRVIFILTLLLTTCTTTPAPTPTSQTILPTSATTHSITLPTLPPKPPYLLSIHPEGRKTKELYEKSLYTMTMGRGVVIEIIDRGDIGIAEVIRAFYGKELLGSLKSRVALYINNQQVDHELFTLADGLMPEGPFWFSWSPFLEPGLHEARYEITTHLGEVLEYSWQFIIEE